MRRARGLILGCLLLLAGTTYGIVSTQLDWFPAPQIIGAAQRAMVDNQDGLVLDETVAAAARSDPAVAPKTELVMLGDSLTLKGRWAERFGDLEVANRGIGGDGVLGVERRLAPIIAGKPKAIFLMIGLNDILVGNDQDAIVRVIERIFARFPEGTEPVLQSVLPCGAPRCGLAENERISALNQALDDLAAKQRIAFVDLRPLFSKGGHLDPALTTDGIHLNAAGYAKWEDAIRPLVAPLISPGNLPSAH